MVGIFESRRGEVEVLTAVQIGQQDFVAKRQIVALADFQIKILSRILKSTVHAGIGKRHTITSDTHCNSDCHTGSERGG